MFFPLAKKNTSRLPASRHEKPRFWGGVKNDDPKRLRLPHLNGFQWFDVQDVVTIVQWWLFIIEGWEAHALEVTSITLAKGRVQGDYGRVRFGNRGSSYYYIDINPNSNKAPIAGKSLKMTIHLAASLIPPNILRSVSFNHCGNVVVGNLSA